MAAFVTDPFTYTANTNLNTHGWVAHRGSIFSDSTGTKATPIDSPQAAEYYNTNAVPPSADYAVRAQITFDTVPGANMGLIARSKTSEATYYFAFRTYTDTGSTNTVTIRRMKAGVATSVAVAGVGTPFTPTGANAMEFRVVTNGAQVDMEVWWGGVLVLPASDTSADRITDAGYPGIGKYNGTRHTSLWDNFEAEVIGAVSTSDVPDRFARFKHLLIR